MNVIKTDVLDVYILEPDVFGDKRGGKMTIIVTGGAGFIGGNFVHYMIEKYKDYRIVCLDALTYAGNLETLESVMDNPNFRFAKGDIADRDFVYKLFEDESLIL